MGGSIFARPEDRVKAHQYPFSCPAVSEVCWVYDLDGTIVAPNFQTDDIFSFDNTNSQKLVWDPIATGIQPEAPLGVIVTFRPTRFRDKTVAQLEPIRKGLHTLYTRDEKTFPVYDNHSVIEYKSDVVAKLLRFYKHINFYDDKEIVCLEIKREFKARISCHHVQHIQDDFAGWVPQLTQVG